MTKKNETEKPLSLKEAIELLEPDVVEKMDSVSLDPLGLSVLANRIARRLVSTGGRPTDKSWEIRKSVPMKEATWLRLEEASRQSIAHGLHVAPGQLAAIVLERGMEQLSRENLRRCKSGKTWEFSDYEFQDESEEEARDLVSAITCGGLW